MPRAPQHARRTHPVRPASRHEAADKPFPNLWLPPAAPPVPAEIPPARPREFPIRFASPGSVGRFPWAVIIADFEYSSERSWCGLSGHVNSDVPNASGARWHSMREVTNRMNKMRELLPRVSHSQRSVRSNVSAKLSILRAGDGDRTRDVQLGKLAFYR